jgi:hypothetical protein
MSLKNLTFVTLAFLFIYTANAQRNFEEYNKLGINGGYTLFDIQTSDLITKQAGGLMAGFTTRGSFRNQFDLIYGITFFNNKVDISGRSFSGVNGGFDQEFMEYTIQAVQINFLGSLNIIKHHLSMEFGPILNVNGRMKLDNDAYANYIVEGYTALKAKDIEDISKVNARLMGGITAGLENFRLMAQYQYGLTNMLKNLNDLELEYSDFKGNSSTVVMGATIYF